MPELKELISERDKIQAELSAIESESTQGISRILNAIKTQRWYFFRNNKYILMDKDTGLLWANLDYFNYKGDKIGNFDEVSGITKWQLPTADGMKKLVSDKTFPFMAGKYYRIKDSDNCYWRTLSGKIDLDNFNTSSDTSFSRLIPCNRLLIANTTYAQDVDPNNKIYSETEREPCRKYYGGYS